MASPKLNSISTRINTLPTKERIKSKKLLQQLFKISNTIDEWPVRTVWAISSYTPESVPVQVAFGVPGRNFPKAISRNRIKRALRECYRTEKHNLAKAAANKGVQLLVMFIYTGRKEETTTNLRPKIILTLSRLIQSIEVGK